MFYTDDPVADYERYSTYQEKELEKLPKCSECGEPIQSEEYFEFDDEIICPDCLTYNHRKWVDDIVC